MAKNSPIILLDGAESKIDITPDLPSGTVVITLQEALGGEKRQGTVNLFEFLQIAAHISILVYQAQLRAIEMMQREQAAKHGITRRQ